MRTIRLLALIALAACGGGAAGDDDDDGQGDAAATDAATTDAAVTDDATSDDAALTDAPLTDAAVTDAVVTDAPLTDAPTGVITGGPCLSGAPGATGYRIRWANGGGTAYPVYEVNGLPDRSRDRAGAYGYQIGFTPQYVDTALAQGGLLLNASSFVDLELTTVGIAQISAARLSIYGRSYNTTASGSFNWQTFEGIGASPTNLVSNVAPYAWYTANMTTEISPGDDGVLIRIKAGPSSGSLAVNRIELCLQAQ